MAAKEPGDLKAELEGFRTLIACLRDQLSAADDIFSTSIPSTIEELDAVAGFTKQATETIMEAAEALRADAVARNCQDLDRVEAQATRIFESCSFQDINGQRITKVIRTLKLIDERINSLAQTLQGSLKRMQPAAVNVFGDPLLNGPALSGQAISQDDIDRLLSDN